MNSFSQFIWFILSFAVSVFLGVSCAFVVMVGIAQRRWVDLNSRKHTAWVTICGLVISLLPVAALIFATGHYLSGPKALAIICGAVAAISFLIVGLRKF